MKMQAHDKLRFLLEETGAVACGAAEACPVEEREWNYFESWLARGYHAGMEYMERHADIRRDPRLLLTGARTVVSAAFNYRQPNPLPGIAAYALGRDYHKVLRKRLKRVVREMRDEFGGEWRICVDSAPILERYWARKCGVGRRSELHGNIVVPGAGSMVFLAELITTLEFHPFSSMGEINPGVDCAAKCEAKRVCPTGALQCGGVVDARNCINYLTIEKKEEMTDEERQKAGNALFGCDICQLADPANMGAPLPVLPEFSPLEGLDDFIRGRGGQPDLRGSALSRSPHFVKNVKRFVNNSKE